MSAKPYKTRSQALCSSRARAEAAKTRFTFAQKEVSLKLEKAQIEASIELLQCEKEPAIATAEAEVLEAAGLMLQGLDGDMALNGVLRKPPTDST